MARQRSGFTFLPEPSLGVITNTKLTAECLLLSWNKKKIIEMCSNKQKYETITSHIMDQCKFVKWKKKYLELLVFSSTFGRNTSF